MTGYNQQLLLIKGSSKTIFNFNIKACMSIK